MDKVVILSFGAGTMAGGFPAVTVQLWDQTTPYPIKFTGALPAAPHIPEFYKKWQLLYLSLYQRLDLCFRIEIEAADVTNVSEREFSDLCQHLSSAINDWFNAKSFCRVVQQLRTHLNTHDDIRFIIETQDRLLQRLPWHLWHVFDDYPYAEVALSAPTYQRSHPHPAPSTTDRARILAILGNSQGIDTQQDRAYLERLSDAADITFLVEPSRETLNHHLWQPWHMVFFAGHSFSQETGVLQLNDTDSLTLEQLQYGLRRAIAQGLKLAIFNSCDGLGLAQSLADLHIPQVIVMREPVPDPVAHQFLRHFLTAFVGGHSLYHAVREARERLQGLEDTYPCAAWLPVIFQNPAEEPPRFHDWHGTGDAPTPPQAAERRRYPRATRRCLRVGALLAVSALATVGIMGLRYTGLLQKWELQVFDRLMRSRPSEPPDDRLLIVAITEDDFQLPVQQQRTGSLSDQALAQLLDVLEPLQPRAIGLDIYRDFPAQGLSSAQVDRLQANDKLFAICKVRDRAIDHPGIAPPPEVPLERQGFSDIVKDRDDVLRRHLIALNPHPASPCQTPYALSMQLAFHYLAADGIAAEFTPDQQLTIGDVVVPRLHTHRGSYHTEDLWGYQTLLNYRVHQSITDIAPTVTLTEALSGQLSRDAVEDRVVLIGVTAASAGDYLATPYSSGFQSYEEIPGVMVQAQMVSQIVSAVHDDRPLLTTLPMGGDGLWIWVWAMAGGVLVSWGRSHPRLAPVRSLAMVAISGTVVGGLYLACLMGLIHGYWLPFVPTVLAFMGTGCAIARLPSTSKPRPG